MVVTMHRENQKKKIPACLTVGVKKLRSKITIAKNIFFPSARLNHEMVVNCR